MSDRLKSKTLHALFWSFFERIGQQGIQFIIGIILARLLLPEEFGLIAMLAIFMAIAQSFINSGFGSALIQKREATATDICSIFFLSIFWWRYWLRDCGSGTTSAKGALKVVESAVG